MQPLWTKKIMQTLGKKSNATSWDKKIKQSLETKNHKTSRDKKITQPLGTNKNKQSLWTTKSRNLSGQKIYSTSQDNKKNHATFWDKKV